MVIFTLELLCCLFDMVLVCETVSSLPKHVDVELVDLLLLSGFAISIFARSNNISLRIQGLNEKTINHIKKWCFIERELFSSFFTI